MLSRKNYRSGREAELSSLDLAMGWGVMAQAETLEHFEITQRNRWYFWQADTLPIPKRQVETHSANIHIVFANEAVAQAAAQVDVNDMVTLEGELIEVVAQDGWRWRSSLTRKDTGRGSCELLLLTRIEPA